MSHEGRKKNRTKELVPRLAHFEDPGSVGSFCHLFCEKLATESPKRESSTREWIIFPRPARRPPQPGKFPTPNSLTSILPLGLWGKQQLVGLFCFQCPPPTGPCKFPTRGPNRPQPVFRSACPLASRRSHPESVNGQRPETHRLLLGGCSLQKWSESPLKADTPLLINQGFCLIRG